MLQAPEWFVDYCGRTAPRSANSNVALVELDDPVAIQRAREWALNQAPEAYEDGTGDATTVWVAMGVKDFGLSESAGLEVMADWNETKAHPPWTLDDLATKNRNAHAYGSRPAGVRSAHADFYAVDIGESKPATKGRLFYVDAAQAQQVKRRPYLVKGLMDSAAFVVRYGDSGSKKSFTSLDLGMHIATGRHYLGRPVKRGLVVYVAAEGGIGMQHRVWAWCKKNEITDPAAVPFALVPCPIDLRRSEADAKELVALIKGAEGRWGQPCVLLVIDTLSRALAGGDENASTDMGAFVRNVDAIRLATGGALEIIHHSGKDKARGARGWSGLRAAVDTELEVDDGVISVTKQRDMDAAPDIRFALEDVPLGTDDEGEAFKSAVVRYLSDFEPVALTPMEQRVLTLVEKAWAKKKKAGEAESVSPAEIQIFDTEFGFKDNSLSTHLKNLGEKFRVVKAKHGQYVRP